MKGLPVGGARRAHTLWEMLIVLAVLGALAGLVAPSLRSTATVDSGVEAAARSLARLLERARLAALERGTTVDVRFDLANGRAWVFAVDGDSMRMLGLTSLIATPGVELKAPDPRPRYVFTPGAASFGTSIEVRGAGGVRRLGVAAWTGEVHVSAR